MGDKIIYPLEDLYRYSNKVIKELALDNDFRRKVNIEFINKKLPISTIDQLIGERKYITQLTEFELIALFGVASEYLKMEAVNPSRYFGSNKLTAYYTFINNHEEIKEIKLKNFLKLTDYDYLGTISYKDLLDIFNSGLIEYNFSTQRESKLKQIGSVEKDDSKKEGVWVKEISLDKAAVSEIEKSILNGTFEDSEIIINCLSMEGKHQKFKFKSDNDIFGELLIIPEIDMNSDETLILNLIDGMHRVSAILSAMNKYYEEKKEWLDGKITLRIVRADLSRAKNIVSQSFKRSNVSKEFLDSISQNDYTKFVDKFLEINKIMTVENTVEAAKAFNKMTSKGLLADVVKKTNIKVNDPMDVLFKAKKMSFNFDLIIRCLEELKIKTNVNSVAIYFYLSYILIGKDSMVLDYVELVENILKENNFNLNHIINTINSKLEVS